MGKKFNSIIFPQSEKYSNSKVSDKKQEVGKHINYLKEKRHSLLKKDLEPFRVVAYPQMSSLQSTV